MNLYLLFFVIYSALIAPITARFSLRLGPRAGFGMRFALSGVPVLKRRAPGDMRDERPIKERDVAHALGSTNLRLLKTAFALSLWRRLKGMVRIDSLYIHARFAFADVCKTALLYALTRETLRGLCAIPAVRRKLSGHVEATFKNVGTEVLIRCIVTARLGSLALAALLFGALYLSKKAGKSPPEEEKHAASH